MKCLSTLLACGAVLAASSTMALATTLTPGTSGPSSVITPVAGPTLATITETLSTSTWTATYTETAFHDSTNTLCGVVTGGCIDFEITVTNSSGSPDSILYVSTGGFPTTGTDQTNNVGYNTAGSSSTAVPPGTVGEDVNGVIDFDYNIPVSVGIEPGTTSDELIIQTSADYFNENGTVTLDDGSSAYSTGFNPAIAATPEPNSLLLLGTGLIGAAGLLFMRRRNAANLS